MARFTHRDSRAGDPDLHTHVAVSNKVQTLDGRWLALDARMLYRFNVAGSEYYNTALEAELTDRLGVTFTERPDESEKRPVREITGVDPRLNQEWSSPGRGDHPDHQRTAEPVPGRPRPGADHGGDDLAAAAGEPVHPAGETRTPVVERATRRLARPGRPGPRR